MKANEKDKEYTGLRIKRSTHSMLLDYQNDKRKEDGVKKSLDELIAELVAEKEQRRKEEK